MNEHDLKHIIEATLLAAGKPITTQQLLDLFDERERPTPELFTTAIGMLIADYENRGIELIEVASGWRIQVRPKAAEVVSRLWSERPAKYSRAFLETLALIAYRQPITRSEIEEIRGVSISSTIMRTLQERGWIRTVGHREVPGRPELLGTTREFLDYFGLKSLDQLPTLAELKDIETIGVQLELPADQPQTEASAEGEAAASTEEGAATEEAVASGEAAEASGEIEASAEAGANDTGSDNAEADVEADGDDDAEADDDAESETVAEADSDEDDADDSDADSDEDSDDDTELSADAEDDDDTELSADAEDDDDAELSADADGDDIELSADSEDDDDTELSADADDGDDTELLADADDDDDDEDSGASSPMVASADDEEHDHARVGEPPSEG